MIKVNPRDIQTIGEETLLAAGKDSLVIPRTLRARDWVRLYAIARLMERGIPHSMAATHPARYKALRDAETALRLKGYDIDPARFEDRVVVEIGAPRYEAAPIVPAPPKSSEPRPVRVRVWS